MPRGSQPGERRGGRTKGVPNRKTAEKVALIEASGLTPLDYMLSVMRDASNEAPLRLDAAKAAAQFVHPKLSTIAATIDASVEGTITCVELVAPGFDEGSGPAST
jgi:hypothetical protein